MRNSKKLLIGVLSVAALIGTGYAAWTIGGVFTGTTQDLNPIVEETIGTRDIALQVSKDENDNIKFDSKADLSVTYNVKAVKAETNLIEGFDPYDLSYYDKVAEDYQPDLTVSARALDSTTGKPLDAGDEFFKIVNLPKEVTYEYDQWLAADYKDNGFPVDLVFEWGDKTGRLNPQEYVDSQLASKTQKEQRAFLQNIIDNLKGVKFEFTFKVEGTVIDNSEPVEDTTGEVTAPSVANSTFLIDGEAISGKLKAGEHQITIKTADGKVVKDNKLIVVENGADKEVTLTDSLTRAAHTYTVTYKFLKDATYSFKYSVIAEDTPVDESVVYEYKTQFEDGLIQGSVYNGNALTVNDALDVLADTIDKSDPGLISEVTDVYKVFQVSKAFKQEGYSGVKFSSSKDDGTMTFKTASKVSKLNVTYISWVGKDTSLTVNGCPEKGAPEEPKYKDGITPETHTYEFAEPTTEFEFTAKERLVITKLEFWLA